MSNSLKKMSLIGLILMIFTSVFGFSNAPIAFYLMGYSSIFWYLFSAILFFIPFALMMAEYGSAYRDQAGGMYAWLEGAIGEKLAFIGTFMWFSSYIVWMVSTASKIWVPLSAFLSPVGIEGTNQWSLFGLNGAQSVGILAILWIFFVTTISSRGFKQILKITSIGGIAVSFLNLILIFVSIWILFKNGGHFAQPLKFHVFFHSPNPDYQSTFGILSFVVFAIFAYGGIEAIGGLVDQTKNPKKNFPRGIILAAITISVGYALAIFLWGASTDWKSVLGDKTTNMGNVAYILMHNLGTVFGESLGLTHTTAAKMGAWFARFTGLSVFLAYAGAFFTLSYSPLKSVILGSPKNLWPDKIKKLNRYGMPANAMWLQFIIVALIILLASFSSKDSSNFYNKLTLMANVSMTLPYLILAGAFPAFKRIERLDRPFIAFKTRTTTMIATWLVFILVFLANLFTIIQPSLALGHLSADTLWMLAGPIIFTLLAIVIDWNYQKRKDTY